MDYFAAAGASLWSWAAGRVSPLSSAAPSREARLLGGSAFSPGSPVSRRPDSVGRVEEGDESGSINGMGQHSRHETPSLA